MSAKKKRPVTSSPPKISDIKIKGWGVSIAAPGTITKPIDDLSELLFGVPAKWIRGLLDGRRETVKARLALEKERVAQDIADLRIERARLREDARLQWEMQNLGRIFLNASSDIFPNAKVSNLSPDWLAVLTREASVVSDTEIASIWSKILAGEVNQPGRFSKRTLLRLSEFDKKDAALFAKLCCYVWSGAKQRVPVIMNLKSPQIRKDGLDRAGFLHLETIGLIHFEPVAGYSFEIPEPFELRYGKKGIRLLKPQHTPRIMSHCALTGLGEELEPLCDRAPLDGMFEAMRLMFPDFRHEIFDF
jgi:hypothetical protein